MGIMIRGGGGLIDEAPVVTELKVVGEPTQSSIDISYKVTDAELQIVRHYITVNDVPAYQKKEITKDVGYESETGVFTYTIAGLEKGTTYTIQIMCDDGLLQGNSNALQAKTKSQLIYSFVINEADSNPATRVTYEDDAVGVEPATSTGLGGWEDKWPFNKIRIVALSNGIVMDEISKTDRTKTTSGGIIPLNSDVMTEFPIIYWRKTAPNGKIKVELSSEPLVGGDCYAHKVDGVVRSSIYVGCYLGYIFNTTQLRSYPQSVAPAKNKTLTQFRTLAQANGEGYELLNFNILTMLQNLWTLTYRSTNSQLAHGKGYTEGTRAVRTGGTATKGWVYGSQNGKEQMCFLGIEDLWGNLWEWVDGFMTKNFDILVNTQNTNFNDTGDGYENLGKISSVAIAGYLSDINTDAKTGFLSRVGSGSETTYYSDWTFVDGNHHGYISGDWASQGKAGMYTMINQSTNSSTRNNVGARLVYIGEVS